MPPSGQRTLTGSSGQDTVQTDTFWGKTMKNQLGTMKNHDNPPKTWNNENHQNRPGTMKNQPITMKNQ